MAERYTLFDKEFYKKNDPFLTPSQLHARLFYVEMKLVNTRLLFWEEYQEIIMLYFRFYGVNSLADMQLMKDIERQIQRSYVKNKLYKGVVVCLSFFKLEDRLTYMIELDAEDIYPISDEIVELIENNKLYKSRTLLSSLAIGCRDLWRMALVACRSDKVLQMPLIVDNKQRILEVPNANIFLIVDELKVKTPHTSLGVCVNPARQLVIEILQDMGYEVEESTNLVFTDLFESVELFTANDLTGICPITAFKHIRYYRTEGNAIAEEFYRRLVV